MDSLHLHDSVVEEVRYQPEVGELTLRFSLCRSEGDGLGSVEDEVIRYLVFSDVRSFSIKPSDPGPLAHDEILKTKVEPCSEGTTIVEFSLQGGSKRDIAILQIVATAAEVRY